MELELPESEVIACLFSLQRHAIEKYVFEAVFKLLAVCKLERNLLVKTCLDFYRVAERQTFKSTGKATLRIRYSGPLTTTERSNTSKLQKLQICLSTSNGNDLKNMIAGELQVSANRLKLISAGKVIEESKMLEAQNLKNGGQIMALFLTTDKETFQVSLFS